MLTDWSFNNLTLTNAILENLSASISSFLQKVYADGDTFAHAYLIPLTSNNNHDNSDKKNDSHDQEESEENQESEENEEGKELEVLSGASDPSKYQQLQDSPEYFYLLKSSEGILEEQFSPPECRV